MQGLQLYGYHGFSDEEQVIGHRYEIDLKTYLFAGRGESDDLGDTVDYGALCLVVEQEFQRKRRRLVECLATEIAAAVLAEFPYVELIDLKVTKLQPPAPFVVAGCGVEMIGFNRSEAASRVT